MDTIERPPAVKTRVPYRYFTDPEIYRAEQKRIFLGPFWNYAGLEAEVAKPGDFKTTFLGDTPIIVTRGKDGRVHAMVNRCAHRGAVVCREATGNRASHQCAYHQWSFDLEGNLIGVPFKAGIGGKGGYDKDFAPADHGLIKLQVATYSGVIFVCADPSVEPLETYLGTMMLPWIDRLLAKPIVILGHTRQIVKANWKLYLENSRDPYHASLLHLFHTTFGIYRSSMGGGLTSDKRGIHTLIRSFTTDEAQEKKAYEGSGLRTYQPDVRLNDPTILESRSEHAVAATNAIQQLFPNVLIAQIQNTLMTRQLIPHGPDAYEVIFTYFGYAADDEDMREKRLLQANFVGPAGYISLEDGWATELIQQAVSGELEGEAFVELGGRDTDAQDNLVNEASIRAFWSLYENIMGFATP
jgi:anthranilate 1,2-dioxygenase large subunit